MPLVFINYRIVCGSWLLTKAIFLVSHDNIFNSKNVCSFRAKSKSRNKKSELYELFHATFYCYQMSIKTSKQQQNKTKIHNICIWMMCWHQITSRSYIKLPLFTDLNGSIVDWHFVKIANEVISHMQHN